MKLQILSTRLDTHFCQEHVDISTWVSPRPRWELQSPGRHAPHHGRSRGQKPGTVVGVQSQVTGV